MLTAEQLALRRTGITSTDITRIVGESPWGNACDVYADKISDDPQSPSTIYQRIGHALEPLVLELIGEQFGIKLAHSATLVHPEMPWAMTTPDGVGIECVGEAKVKSVSWHRANEWDDDETPPAYVQVQAQWHMIVRRVPVCYVGALLGVQAKFYAVEHDETLATMLLDEGDRFHREHVLARVPPPVDGSEGAKRMLAKAWPKNTGTTIRAARHVEQLAAEYFAASRYLKEVGAEKELVAQRIKEIIGPHDGVTGDGWRATLKERAAVEVAAHTKKPYRHFDIRQVKTP